MKDWLKKRISLEELEAAMLRNEITNIKSTILNLSPLANVRNNNEWTKMKSALIEGDEIWEFCSSGESFSKMMGRSGICVVRNGEIIMELITLMN